MEANIETSFRLILIGMSTVFVILLLVVLSSKVLINVVNRIVSKKTKLVNLPDKIDPSMVAAIVTSVHTVTQGKGAIISIEKE
jgi:oxaloacetate decarboxylase gamma subunit